MKKDDLLTNVVLRERYVNKTEVLDKVKAVPLFPNELFVGVNQAARYYGVGISTIAKMLERNKSEFKKDGVKVITGEELQKYHKQVIDEKIMDELNNPYIGNKSRLYTIVPKRALLRIGMLLKRSDVAIQIREYLLNLEKNSTKKQKVVAIQEIATKESVQVSTIDVKQCTVQLPSVNISEEKAKAELELLEISKLIKQCTMYGIPKTKTVVLIQEAKIAGANVQTEILNEIKNINNIKESIKRGRLTQMVAHLAVNFYDSDFEMVWHVFSDKMKLEIGINMRSLRAKFKVKKDAPSYLDYVAKYYAHAQAEDVLTKMLKEKQAEKNKLMKDKVNNLALGK